MRAARLLPLVDLLPSAHRAWSSRGSSYENDPRLNLRTSRAKSDPAFTGSQPVWQAVPMLEADGRDRVQSMAMLEWLEEAYPRSAAAAEQTLKQRYTGARA